MLDEIEIRLKEIGLNLPEPTTPIAEYVPWKIDGSLLYVSGQLPFSSEGLITGHIYHNREDCIQTAQKAAQFCTLHILAQAKKAIDSLDRINSIVKLTGYVNCSENFTEISKVINGASKLLIQIFGENGRHVRSAIGCSSLPMGAMVELDAIFSIS